MRTLQQTHSILIVDDEPHFREMLARQLSNAGYLVTEVQDGVAAIERLTIEAFDVVLLDLHMANMNGIEVLEWMAERRLFRHTSVIVLSADNNRDRVVSCLDLGAHDYVVKDTPFYEKLKRIERLCITREMQTEVPASITNQDILASRIVVVDDNEANREILQRQLSRAGYACEGVADGPHALEHLQHHKADLVLLDIQMPEMDGFQVLKALREAYDREALAVIMVTALQEQDTMHRCYELGADDYIAKPFNSVELLLRVATTLKLKALSAEEQKRQRRLAELVNVGKAMRE